MCTDRWCHRHFQLRLLYRCLVMVECVHKMLNSLSFCSEMKSCVQKRRLVNTFHVVTQEMEL